MSGLSTMAAVSAFVSGALLWPCALRAFERRRARPPSGNSSELRLSVGGLDSLFIRKACDMASRSRSSPKAGKRPSADARLSREIALSGLSGALDGSDVAKARLLACATFAAVGLCAGALFSVELAALLCAIGGAFGQGALGRALRRESRARADEVERDLPEMVEVVALGLRSGMSFDRSLELYCRHFDGRLAGALESARRRWTMGLATREEALRGMASGYDSSLLSRMVESTVRSLRFGSSLAEALDAFAEEARDARKARLEERIAKTPVKMMLPVGTLILPAMLLLVLGPVLLELAQGF